MANYVMIGRPTGTGCTSLFLMNRVPASSLNAGAVGSIMARESADSGRTGYGPAACRASLSDTGQVLHHRSQLSTAIYAKVGWERLRELARLWPLACDIGYSAYEPTNEPVCSFDWPSIRVLQETSRPSHRGKRFLLGEAFIATPCIQLAAKRLIRCLRPGHQKQPSFAGHN